MCTHTHTHSMQMYICVTCANMFTFSCYYVYIFLYPANSCFLSAIWNCLYKKGFRLFTLNAITRVFGFKSTVLLFAFFLLFFHVFSFLYSFLSCLLFIFWFLFCFVLALLRCNLQKIKFTNFKCVIQWILIKVHTHVTITTIQMHSFFVIPQISSMLLCNNASAPTTALSKHWSTFFKKINLFILFIFIFGCVVSSLLRTGLL